MILNNLFGLRTCMVELEHLSIECPNMLLYHAYGQLPHLIDDTFLKVRYLSAITKNDSSLAKYIANDGTLFYTSNDPCLKKKEYSSKFKIKSLSGLHQVKPKDFIQLQRFLAPAICDIPADIVWNENATSTRHLKSHKDSMKYIDECIELKEKCPQDFANLKLFGSALGGIDVGLRILAASELATKPVDGYSIENLSVQFCPYLLDRRSHVKGSKRNRDGLERGKKKFPEDVDISDNDSNIQSNEGSECGDDGFRWSEYEKNLSSLSSLVQASTGVLPVHKPRILQGPWDPLQIISSVRAGVDLFDSSYSYALTQRGLAINFTFGSKSFEKNGSPPEDRPQCVLPNFCNNLEIIHKSDAQNNFFQPFPFTLNLKDSRYASDAGPLAEGCTCYTCLNYSRAYVNHLLNCSELLAGILLSVHNLDTMADFFEYLKLAIKCGKLDLFENAFREQLPNYPSNPS